MPRPGSEPYRHDGGPVGVLLCHGFTGSPASLRPWAEHLASADLSVRLPLLPGHGTEWQQMGITGWPDWYGALERELLSLGAQSERVFVMGLSVGGALALRLAEQHPDRIAGVVTVNALLRSRHPIAPLLPLLRWVLPSYPGVVNDIKRPGQDEIGYDRVPLQAAHSAAQGLSVTHAGLAAVQAPILIMHSNDDHVVEPQNARLIVDGVSSRDLTFIPLHDSFHVATLDNDAPFIFEQSLAFVQRLTSDATTAWESTGADAGEARP